LRSKPLSGSGSSDSNVTVSVMLSSELLVLGTLA